MGRDFLTEHILWQIINRENVFIWNDNWISRLEKKIENPSLVDSHIPKNVVAIMDKVNGEWKLDSIEQWLIEAQYLAIKVIPVCEQRGNDLLVWPYCKGGEYTMKFGYYKLKGEKVVIDNNFLLLI